MILRDPVHGLVAFEGDAERVVSSLLATREVQRLRRVRQLGLTSFVFLGAEHSRFAHAIGAAHVMARLMVRLDACAGELPAALRLDDEARRDALAGALLHDLGHGPFSHLFEEVVPAARSHEAWTRDVVEDPSTDVHRALTALDAGMPSRVAALLRGEHRLPWLSGTVSGTLDVDRCDYLLRDSHMTGVAYGLYDLDWLLRALTFAEAPRGDWVVAIEGRKGLQPIEGFFLGRHFMYHQIYHHKATRAAECLIRGMFRRLAELIREGATPEGTPEAVRAAVLGEPLSPSTYLDLDDALLMACFASWERSPDATLAELSSRVRHRRLPKTIPLPEGEGAEPIWERARARAEEIALARGLRPDLHVWLDLPTDTPYTEPDDDGPGGLWVSLRHRPLARPAEISFLLRQLRGQPVVRPRLVLPESIRDEVSRELDGTLT